jgi:hypothetical protein
MTLDDGICRTFHRTNLRLEWLSRISDPLFSSGPKVNVADLQNAAPEHLAGRSYTTDLEVSIAVMY